MTWVLVLVVFGTVVLLGAGAHVFPRSALRASAAAAVVVGAIVLARTGDGTPASGAQEVARWLTDRAFGRPRTLNAAEWLAVGLVLAMAYRRAEIVNARRISGPVDVTIVLGHDGKPEDPAGPPLPEQESLRALMRQRLAECQLLPAQRVPGASVQPQLADIVQTNPLAELTGLSSVVSSLLKAAVPPAGYKVTATTGVDPGSGARTVTVDMTDARTHRSLGIETVEGATHEEAAEKAAYWVASEVLRQCTTIHSWQRWASPCALRCYIEGTRADAQGDRETALDKFIEARKRSPQNLHAAVAVPPLEELDNRRWEAIAHYARILYDHPDLVEIRYRLAILCYLVDSWGPGLLGTGPELALAREQLRKAVEERRRALGKGAPANPLANGCHDLATVTAGFYAMAEYELGQIKRSLRHRRLMAWRLRRCHRWFDSSPVVLLPVPVFSSERHRLLALARTATYAVELKRAKLEAGADQPGSDGSGTRTRSQDLLAEEDRITAAMEAVLPKTRLRRKPGWQAYYNAGCVLATRIPPRPAGTDAGRRWETDYEPIARRAVEYVTQAYVDDDSDFQAQPEYITSTDPDLENLRHHPVWKAWISAMRFDVSPQRLPPEEERDELVDAWNDLRRCAHDLGADWEERITTGTVVGSAAALAAREGQLWTALAMWAQSPRREHGRAPFHRLVRGAVPCHPKDHVPPPARPDYGDPWKAVREHRRGWSGLSTTAAEVAEHWERRRRLLADRPAAALALVPAWAEDACRLWHTVEGLTLKPRCTEAQEQFAEAAAITEPDPPHPVMAAFTRLLPHRNGNGYPARSARSASPGSGEVTSRSPTSTAS